MLNYRDKNGTQTFHITSHEQNLINNYRAKPRFRGAIDALLDMKPQERRTPFLEAVECSGGNIINPTGAEALGELVLLAEDMGLEIHEFSFKGSGRGYIVDDIIGINKSLSPIEKRCVLAEEIGHFLANTGDGDITDQTCPINREAEMRGRRAGHRLLVSPEAIVNTIAFCGCRSKYEIAKYLYVTEEYLQEAIDGFVATRGITLECEKRLQNLEKPDSLS